jgi:large subunit ribosomal protein L6e
MKPLFGDDTYVQSVLQREEKELPEEKKDDQKAIDAILIPIIEKIPDLKSYLASRFSLKSGVKPHELVF